MREIFWTRTTLRALGRLSRGALNRRADLTPLAPLSRSGRGGNVSVRA
jgi:hypothetical protein